MTYTKQVSEESEEKENIELAATSARISDNGYQELNVSNLQSALNINFGENYATAVDNGDGTFTIKINDRWYTIDNNEKVKKDINWDLAKENAVAPEEQNEERNNRVIGIGTDGNPVNMDLWEYSIDSENNGYGLNDNMSIETNASADASKGYLGTDYSNIVIPQYISKDNGINWAPVTSLDWTFYKCTELVRISKIPSTVVSMRHTFRDCDSLQEMCFIPDSVINMQGTFNGCSSLEKIEHISNNAVVMQTTFNCCSNLKLIPNISNKVENMKLCFNECTQLYTVPNIPNTVSNLDRTFRKCTNLKVDLIIPESVTMMFQTFYYCTSLTGTLEINANLTGAYVDGSLDYGKCFERATTNEEAHLTITGTCPMINELLATKSTTSNISIKK